MHTPRPYTCIPNTRWLRPGAMEAAVLTSRMLAARLLLAKTKQPERYPPSPRLSRIERPPLQFRLHLQIRKEKETVCGQGQ